MNRRIRLARFLCQAGHFSVAEREIQGILTAFPGEKAVVEAEMTSLNIIRWRERYEDVKRLHVAGQYKTVRKILDNFPQKDLTPDLASEVAILREDYKTADEKIKETKRLLAVMLDSLLDGKVRPTLMEAATTLSAELQPDVLVRLEAFVGQAKKYEKEKTAGKSPPLSPEEVLSLAVTGWLLGGASAETKPAAALRLWHARQMMIAYMKTDDASRRLDLVTAYSRQFSEQRLDELLQIVPTLPPPEPEANLDTVNPIVQVAGGRGGPSYLVQLPPEYRHNRTYPVLVVLHEAGQKPLEMLRRWTDAAAEHGYILIAPDWQPAIAGYAFSVREHNILLASLHDLRRKYSVDSDRVFLFGQGQGGAMAFDVGLSHPDLFAGVSTMGAHPEMFSERYVRNAQYLPFYVVSGNTVVNTAKALRKCFADEWNSRGYPALWIEYRGRGVEWFGGEVPNIMDWMRTKRRAFPLHKLGSDGLGGRLGNEFTSMRTTDNRFYWLSTNTIDADRLNSTAPWKPGMMPAMLSARIDPSTNTIHVVPKGMRQVTVWLGRNSRGENMIDFDKPVTITIAGRAMWSKKPVTPSLETLLEDLYQRGDRQRPYLAKVDLNW